MPSRFSANLKLTSPDFAAVLEQALLASTMCAFAQGFALLGGGARAYHWPLNPVQICGVWSGGCIIRCRLLDWIEKAFTRDPALKNMLLDARFSKALRKTEAGLRKVVDAAAASGIPIPAMASALSYFDAYRSGRLGANLIQAQRDYFGATWV